MLLGTAGNNLPQVLLHWPFVFENWLYVMYLCWCYVQGSNFVTDPEGKMSCLTNSIIWLKGGVQMEQERQLQQTEDELFKLAGQMMVLPQISKHSPEEEWGLVTLWE